MTYERCIVELIVKNKQSRAKYVGNSECALSRDAVGFTKGINTARIMIEIAKRLVDGSIYYHACVVHKSPWSRVSEASLSDTEDLVSYTL